MMRPEDQLDNLLSATPDHTGSPASQVEELAVARSDLAALVRIALFVETATNMPHDTQFAERLRTRMLARAATRREEAHTLTPGGSIVPISRETLRWAQSLRHAWRLWGAVAVIVLTLGLGAMTALASSAAPGTALFQVRRLDQHVRIAITTDTASRARLHLRYAREWLADLQQDVRPGLNEVGYRAALNALLADEAAAEQETSQITDGAVRANVEAELAAFRTIARSELAAVLPGLTWPLRILTTQALGGLGASVPHVTAVEITPIAGGKWQVVLTGSGFQPGAVLLLNGEPGGTVITVTATTLSADFPASVLRGGMDSLGIGNPDGTAAGSITLPDISAPHGAPATPSDGNNGAHPTPSTVPHVETPTPRR